jgi:predicted ATPase
VAQRPGLDLAASILEYLRGRELLVVLDNCEHLLDATGRLSEGILRECANVRILATSREGLGVEGERVVALRSLGVPEPGAERDAIATSDAARLFLERARSAQAEFELDDAASGAVAEICRRLDGIPLAIELAAARVVAMHPREIAEHLDERFRLLTGGRRTAVERHHTLRATVDWSYSLLGPTEQAVFARLGVFAGSFDAAAAQAVVSGDGIEHWDVVDALSDLVAKSMVTADRSSGTTRYQLLETLRQYSRELLDDQDASDHWRRRHAEHFVAFAAEAGAAVLGPDELDWYARIVDDLDNLRAVVIWSLDRDDPADVDLALRVIVGLIAAGLWHRELGVARWALDATARVADAAPDRRAAVRSTAASGAVQAGDLAHAEDLARAALEDRAAAAPLAVTNAYVVLSLVRAHAGEFRAALEILDGALAELSEVPERADSPFALTGLHSTAMYWALMGGDVERATAEARTALEQGRQVGNPSSLAMGLLTFGYVCWRDDPQAALTAIEEGVQLVREGAVDNSFAGGLQAAALIYASRGQTRDAVVRLREALRYEQRIGDRVTTASVLFCIVNILGSGHPEIAATCVGIVTVGPLAGLGFHVDPDGYERGCTAAEHTLGEQAFRALGAETVPMSFDDACVHVIGELDRILAELPDA